MKKFLIGSLVSILFAGCTFAQEVESVYNKKYPAKYTEEYLSAYPKQHK